MASGIAVTPERLREISAQMTTGAAEVRAILYRLSGSVAPVRTEWTGTAQAQFNYLWDQLEQSARGLHSVLTGIAKLTDNAANAYEATEQRIAQSFDEFRIDPASVPGFAGDNGAKAPVLTDVTLPQGTTLDPQGPESEIVVEIDDNPSDDDDSSAGRGKASMRLPWTRFMTKGPHDSATAEVMIDTRRRERRFKTSDPALKPGTRLCRLCFTVVVLEPEYIEMTETYSYVCCPHCEGSFPVRRSDVEALLLGQTPTS